MNWVAFLVLTPPPPAALLSNAQASSRQVMQGAPKHATDRDGHLTRPTT